MKATINLNIKLEIEGKNLNSDIIDELIDEMYYEFILMTDDIAIVDTKIYNKTMQMHKE